MLEEIHFPHSLGLLYSAFTYFTGFKVNSGEYKLMGLAPYGDPVYADAIREHLIDIREDGSFHLNMDYFGYLDGLTMTNRKFETLFGGPPRKPESEISQREMDLARSIQVVTEEVVLKMARQAARLTGAKQLCLAGGVALNCVANGLILREGPFEDIWIQPAAGDAGGALGAALFVWHQVLGNPRPLTDHQDQMAGAYLGPAFTDDEIAAWLQTKGYPFRRLPDGELEREVARLIAEQNVVGLFQGRMEFGPRALGARSIVGDARSPKMQSVLNLKIKRPRAWRRESGTTSRSTGRRPTCCWSRRCNRSAARRWWVTSTSCASSSASTGCGRTCPPSRTWTTRPASSRSRSGRIPGTGASSRRSRR
jgi:carbamoyltransferase